MGEIMVSCLNILNMPLTIEGFSFSLWNVLLFGCIASIAGYGIGKMLK